jgi:hypothetical protein
MEKNRHPCERKYEPEVPIHLKPYVIPDDPPEIITYKCVPCNYRTTRKYNMKIHERSDKHQQLVPAARRTYDFKNDVSACLSCILNK